MPSGVVSWVFIAAERKGNFFFNYYEELVLGSIAKYGFDTDIKIDPIKCISEAYEIFLVHMMMMINKARGFVNKTPIIIKVYSCFGAHVFGFTLPLNECSQKCQEFKGTEMCIYRMCKVQGLLDFHHNMKC